MSNGQGDEYDDSNRAFLQALIARSTFSFEEAQRVLATILTAYNQNEVRPEDITQEIVNTYVSAANDAVSRFDMEVRSTVHQVTKQRVYAIINSTSDPSTQMATSFTPDEISYVKRVLDAMFDTNNTLRHEIMAIQPIQATKLHKPPNRASLIEAETQGSAGTQITVVQAEKVLSSLVEQGWFEKSRKVYYSLTPRALMELRGWLEETYNDEEDEDINAHGRKIKTCHACREIVTYGQRCAKLTCPCRFHDSCADGSFRVQRERVCPLCKTRWTGKDFVGERAASDKAASKQRANASQIPTTSSTSHRRQQLALGGDGNDDDDDDD